jgi:hypothetical protein
MQESPDADQDAQFGRAVMRDAYRRDPTTAAGRWAIAHDLAVKAGRPALPDDQRRATSVTFRLKPAGADALGAFAADLGVTTSEAVRLLLGAALGDPRLLAEVRRQR